MCIRTGAFELETSGEEEGRREGEEKRKTKGEASGLADEERSNKQNAGGKG